MSEDSGVGERFSVQGSLLEERREGPQVICVMDFGVLVAALQGTQDMPNSQRLPGEWGLDCGQSRGGASSCPIHLVPLSCWISPCHL